MSNEDAEAAAEAAELALGAKLFLPFLFVVYLLYKYQMNYNRKRNQMIGNISDSEEYLKSLKNSDKSAVYWAVAFLVSLWLAVAASVALTQLLSLPFAFGCFSSLILFTTFMILIRNRREQKLMLIVNQWSEKRQLVQDSTPKKSIEKKAELVQELPPVEPIESSKKNESSYPNESKHDLDNEEPIFELAEEILWAKSTTEMIFCPTCNEKLRIPCEKRPIFGRCPKCDIRFEARNE